MVQNLWISLQDTYRRTRVGGNPEILQTDQLQSSAKLFLDAVRPSERLHPIIFYVLLQNSHNVSSWRSVSMLMFAMEQYTINLLTYPWKKEYYKIRMYSGFYKTKVEGVLPSAALESLFSLLNYQRSGNYVALKTLLDHSRLKCLSVGFYLAALECENYHEIFSTFHKKGMTIASAMMLRSRHEGSLRSCYSMIDKDYVQTNKLQLLVCDSLSVNTEPEELQTDSGVCYETPSDKELSCQKVFDSNECTMLNSRSQSVIQDERKQKYVQEKYSSDGTGCRVINIDDKICDTGPVTFLQNDANAPLQLTQHMQSNASTRHSPTSKLRGQRENTDNCSNFSISSSDTTSEQFSHDRPQHLYVLSCNTAYEKSTTNASSTARMLPERTGKREKHQSDFLNEQPQSKLKYHTLQHPVGQKVSQRGKDPLGKFSDANKVDGEQEDLKWQCGSCTYLNDPPNTVCTVCYASRDYAKESSPPLESGSKECAGCTFINSKSASRCEICQNDLHGSSTYV